MEGDIHLLNSAYKFNDAHKITGFVYSMDFDNSIALSNISYGLAYRGDYGFAKLAASYARQTDTGSMPIEYSADYMAIDLSGKMTSTFNWKAGYELLGSDKGDQAFKTPLATLHKFQGWSDKFLATPADGVQDIYAGVSGKMGDVTLKLFYHEFSSDNTSADFGSELDVLAIYPVSQRVKTLLKFASYRADQHATDTSKLWFQLQVSL